MHTRAQAHRHGLESCDLCAEGSLTLLAPVSVGLTVLRKPGMLAAHLLLHYRGAVGNS